MSIIKFSPEDITYLIERLNKIESELRALKMEDKVHHTAVKDGAFRVIDDSDSERLKMGKLTTGVYGIKIYDSVGGLIMEISDDAVTGVTSIAVQATAPPGPSDKDVWMDI